MVNAMRDSGGYDCHLARVAKLGILGRAVSEGLPEEEFREGNSRRDVGATIAGRSSLKAGESRAGMQLILPKGDAGMCRKVQLFY